MEMFRTNTGTMARGSSGIILGDVRGQRRVAIKLCIRESK